MPRTGEFYLGKSWVYGRMCGALLNHPWPKQPIKVTKALQDFLGPSYLNRFKAYARRLQVELQLLEK